MFYLRTGKLLSLTVSERMLVSLSICLKDWTRILKNVIFEGILLKNHIIKRVYLFLLIFQQGKKIIGTRSTQVLVPRREEQGEGAFQGKRNIDKIEVKVKITYEKWSCRFCEIR